MTTHNPSRRALARAFAAALLLVAALAAAPSGLRGDSSAAAPVNTVQYVDLARYTGLWYEIALIPNRFQKKCVGGTTAEYRLREDGRIDVINSCLTAEGKRDEAHGIARVEDRVSNARLKVSFVRFLGRSWFWGNYWIIGLGRDYEYAVIGTPDRKYGWILARDPSPGAETMDAAFAVLRANGYNPDDFQLTAHAESEDIGLR